MSDFEPTILAIGEAMTIYQAQAQKEQLLDALAAAQHVQLDLSEVPEIDSAGLQLLLLVNREALRQNRQMTIVRLSPCVRHVIDFCNLTGLVGDPPAETVL